MTFNYARLRAASPPPGRQRRLSESSIDYESASPPASAAKTQVELLARSAPDTTSITSMYSSESLAARSAAADAAAPGAGVDNDADALRHRHSPPLLLPDSQPPPDPQQQQHEHEHEHEHQHQQLGGAGPGAGNGQESLTHLLGPVFHLLKRFIPICILLAVKVLYDHRIGIVVTLGLYLSFCYCDKGLRDIIARRVCTVLCTRFPFLVSSFIRALIR